MREPYEENRYEYIHKTKDQHAWEINKDPRTVAARFKRINKVIERILGDDNAAEIDKGA